MIAGLDRPTAGDVLIGGSSLGAMSDRALRKARHKLVSNIYQQPGHNLLPGRTALEQVERTARRRGLGLSDARTMLELLGLEDRLRHRPEELSGGEQQRVAFARGAVGNPTVVIADEPTAELDSASGQAVIDAMDTLAAAGSTIVVATHDPAAMHAATHVVLLRDGAIASETGDDIELAVIDQSGRIQLPPAARSWFPEDRALIHVDEDNERVWIERP
jgi:putative ABC transport system ATP-binding protein